MLSYMYTYQLSTCVFCIANADQSMRLMDALRLLRCNVGYGFINFRTSPACDEFIAKHGAPENEAYEVPFQSSKLTIGVWKTTFLRSFWGSPLSPSMIVKESEML